jgi:hypothetical protein
MAPLGVVRGGSGVGIISGSGSGQRSSHCIDDMALPSTLAFEVVVAVSVSNEALERAAGWCPC